MGQFLDTVLAYFAGLGWEVTFVEGKPILRMEFSSERGDWTCLAHVREALWQVLFYSVFPANVPPERRAAMTELLTRANYGLAIGNFEMDCADGEVRYKTSLDTQGEPLTPALLKGLVIANLATMRAYYPAIDAVQRGEMTPDAAMELARQENPPTA